MVLRNKITIRALEKVDGGVIDSVADINTEFFTYLSSLWATPTSQLPFFNWSVIPCVLSKDDNNWLTRDLIMDEFYSMIQNMPGDKAPSPEFGMIYNRFWFLIRKDMVISEAMEFHLHSSYCKE